MSDIDLFVAGSEDAIIMVEGSAKEVREGEILEAILFGHQSLKPVIETPTAAQDPVQGEGKAFELRRPDAAVYERMEAMIRTTLDRGLPDR